MLWEAPECCMLLNFPMKSRNFVDLHTSTLIFVTNSWYIVEAKLNLG